MPANTAPTLDTSTAPVLPTVLQGSLNPGGVTVTDLVGGRISDADGATDAIALTAVDTSLGQWQYSLDGGTHWLTVAADQLNQTGNELALLLGASARLRLLPFGELNGSLGTALTFRAWDRSTGTEGSFELITATGGTSAFSDDDLSASIAVSATAAPNRAASFASGTPGIARLQAGQGYAVAVQADGRTVQVGGNGQFVVLRTLADSSPDTGWSGDGAAAVTVGSQPYNQGFALAVQPDGKVVVVGSNGVDPQYNVLRLNSDGSPDTGFGTGGQQQVSVGSGGDLALAVALQTDGRILVAGRSADGTGIDMGLIRLNSDGSLDTGFGTAGAWTGAVGTGYSWVQALAVQDDGQILLAGNSTGAGGDFTVVRLDSSGSPDTAFGTAGVVQVAVSAGNGSDQLSSMALLPDGRILLAGHTFNGSGYDMAVVRLLSDGSLDTSFDTDGKLVLPVGSTTAAAYAVAVQPDGQIVLAGYSGNGSDTDWAVLRLNSDGSPDTAFGTGGETLISFGSISSARSIALQPDGKIVVSGVSYDSGLVGPHHTLVRLNSDGSLDTGFQGTGSLTASQAYPLDTVALRLDSSITLVDPELAALNGGLGNYDGASLSLGRHGGASAQDSFSAQGNLSFSGGNAILSGTTVGSVSQSGGLLNIVFNAQASQAVVNEVLSGIAYTHASPTTMGSVQLDWVFNDGNSGSQGTGGSQSVVGTQTLVSPIALAPTAGNDSLLGTGGDDAMAGGAGNDTLDAGTGHDTLDGGSGKDVLIGGMGDDLYVVDSSRDTVTEVADSGYDTVETALSSLTLAANAERLVYTGSGKFNGKGNAGDNRLDGAAAIDTLNGLDGHDQLHGHGDNDKLSGGNGNDSLYGGEGNDSLSGGNDNDLALGGNGADTLKGDKGADSLYGDAGADRLTGGADNDSLDGGTDNDTLLGDGGNDSLAGGDGLDSLAGGSGNDLLQGGAGSDTMQGGTGNDTLQGGAGADFLSGGSGADTFLFDTLPATDSIDTLIDFSAPSDTIQLDHLVFDQLGAVGALASTAFAKATNATEAGHRLLLNPLTLGLWYDADGSGAGAAVQIATLVGSIDKITAADFWVA